MEMTKCADLIRSSRIALFFGSIAKASDAGCAEHFCCAKATSTSPTATCQLLASDRFKSSWISEELERPAPKTTTDFFVSIAFCFAQR